MYELEVVVRGNEYKVTASTEEGARVLIGHAYAAWGEPIPMSLDDGHAAAFAARLAKTGTYYYAEGSATVAVRRTTG